MKLVITANDPSEISAVLASFIRRTAEVERAFGEVTKTRKRSIAESLYAAECLDRLADMIAEMDIIIEKGE